MSAPSNTDAGEANDTARTTGDSAEALLARGVPYLKFDPLAVNQHFLDFEINPVEV
jgi:hypothetical protein